MKKTVRVGIGEIGTVSAPDEIYTSLGSCAGVVLYDPQLKAGGLLHVFLPKNPGDGSSPARYADSGIPLLVGMMERKHKVSRKRLLAGLFGCAVPYTVPTGTCNEKETLLILEREKIPVKFQKTGGKNPYSVHFIPERGEVLCGIGNDAPSAFSFFQ